MPAEQLYSRSNRELSLGDHAAIAERFHPDPFRTRQLSSLASVIVLRYANSRELVNAAPPFILLKCLVVFFYVECKFSFFRFSLSVMILSSISWISVMISDVMVSVVYWYLVYAGYLTVAG